MDASAKLSPELRKTPKRIPALIVTQRVVTVSRTSRDSILGAASSLEASTAARRPKPSGALRRATVSSPRRPGVHVGLHAVCRHHEADPKRGHAPLRAIG